jgi:hypothetical protein
VLHLDTRLDGSSDFMFNKSRSEQVKEGGRRYRYREGVKGAREYVREGDSDCERGEDGKRWEEEVDGEAPAIDSEGAAVKGRK